MNLLPRSSFSRLVVLIGGLVLLVHLSFFGLATHFHARQNATAQGRRVGKEILTVERVLRRSMGSERSQMRNLLLAELGFHTSSIPPRGVILLGERTRYVDRNSQLDEGGRLLGSRRQPSSEHQRGNLDFFEDGVQDILGPGAQLYVRIHGRGDLRGEPRVWIRTGREGIAWVGVPGNYMKEPKPELLAYWVGGIALLIFFTALLFARQLNRPLLALVRAVEALGRGEKLQDVPESGPDEVRKLTRSFNTMARDVTQAAMDRELMLAGISHDLRSPLARLSVAVEMASDLPADLKESMEEDISDMDTIVGQFLTFVRTGMNEPVEEVDLVGLVREVVDRVQRAAGEKESQPCIELELPERLEFQVRPMSIKRLLHNLIDNAVRYGGKRVFVSLEERGIGVSLAVEDDGPGIEEAKLEELFRPFARGSLARTTTGTGLGLAIVKKIATLHGGSVCAKQSRHGGVCFLVELPRSVVDTAEAPTSASRLSKFLGDRLG